MFRQIFTVVIAFMSTLLLAPKVTGAPYCPTLCDPPTKPFIAEKDVATNDEGKFRYVVSPQNGRKGGEIRVFHSDCGLLIFDSSSICWSRPCLFIAYNASSGSYYDLGGASGHEDCPAFQREFKKQCCAATAELKPDYDVCKICTFGVDTAKM
jgi:hypothetical protein